MAPRLELRSLSKRYGSVVANDAVSLIVEPGEIHAVLGENGAGKSTLMKMIHGAVQPDHGAVLWEGRSVRIANPAAARRLGIGMVHQHFALFETVAVVDNIAVALAGRFDRRALAARITALGRRYGLDVDPWRVVHALSVGERQRVEILRCLLQDPKLLILDEPTSVLTPQAALRLFEVLRRLAAEGCSILYVSHKLDEIGALCSAATVLRGGRVVGHADPRHASAAELARLMVGASPPPVRRAPQARTAAPCLELKELTQRPVDPFGTALAQISLELYGGEVVGIAGVSGNGQRELVAALSGETPSAPGMVLLDGRPIGALDVAARRVRGLALVPEERLGRGAAPNLSLADNGLLTGHRAGLVRRGFIRRGRVDGFARGIIDAFDVRCTGVRAAARSLSGGNLQKFIVGRELALAPRVLVVAQPTWGVDVAAAASLRQRLVDLSRAGAAVLVLSEELDELFEICDRIAVLHAGRLNVAKARADTSIEAVGLAMTGSTSLLETAA
jgi:simple sugar transport system ATP-binding protein